MSFFKSDKKLEEITQLRQEILELTRMIKVNESTIEKITEESIQSQKTIQEIIAQQKKTEFQQRSRFDALEKEISDLEERMKKYMEITNNQNNKLSAESTSNFEERINDEIAILSQSQKRAQTRIETLTQALDLLGNGVEELNQIIQQQTIDKGETSDEEESGVDWSKQTINEIIDTIKDEQRELFNKFSEIVDQFNVDFHEELTDTVKTLRESHDRILGEIGDHYMPKSIGHELQQLLNEFSDEFKFETQNLRVQIVNIKYYQKELQQFKQEIQTLIDHKVNERLNVISRLLSIVTTKTEKISLYLKNSEIQITPSTEQTDMSENQKEF